MKTGFIEQENRRHHLVKSNRPKINNRWTNAFLISALKKFVSEFKAHLGAGALSRNTFIWLPFTGGISAFAVVLPKPRE
jgi:hypothetical protein